MNSNPISPNDFERDMPEVEKQNVDLAWEDRQNQKFTILSRMKEIEEETKRLAQMLEYYREPTFREEDEDDDPEARYERAEQRAEAEFDRKLEQWAEKHMFDRDL